MNTPWQILRTVIKIVFFVFLAANAYDQSAPSWQNGLVLLAATGLILFLIGDIMSAKAPAPKE